MPNKNMINNNTLIPLGVVIALVSSLFMFFASMSERDSKTEVQAAEIDYLKADYFHHKKTSEKYFMGISKALSRIEGKLESLKK